MIARCVCGPSALYASYGPYADDERPSAPRPTQARKAIRVVWWKISGSLTSRALPITIRRRRRIVSSPRSSSLFIATSNLHLRSELDHLIRRQTEVLRGAARIAHHPCEETFAPDGHARRACGDQSLPAKEVARAHGIKGNGTLDAREQRRNVRVFHEAKAHDQTVNAIAEVVPLMPFLLGEVRRFFNIDRQ